MILIFFKLLTLFKRWNKSLMNFELQKMISFSLISKSSIYKLLDNHFFLQYIFSKFKLLNCS